MKYPDDGGASRRFYIYAAVVVAVLVGLAIAAFLPYFL